MKKGTILRNNCVSDTHPYKYGIYLGKSDGLIKVLVINRNNEAETIKYDCRDVDRLVDRRIPIQSIGQSNVLVEITEHIQAEFERIRQADNVNLESEEENAET